jgi:hypothetical protein
MSTTKTLKVALNFTRLGDSDLLTTCYAVDTGMTGNDKFTNPVIEMPTFKTQIATLAAAIAAAQDGGRSVIAEKNKQRALTIKMLTKLARYVEEVANNDLAILTSSGFQALTSSLTAKQPAKPAIDKILQKKTGELTVVPTSVAARLYETQCGALGPGGAPPASWTKVHAPNAKPGSLFTGLTPGTIYVFQVRAYTNSGWTDWSDPVTKMST